MEKPRNSGIRMSVLTGKLRHRKSITRRYLEVRKRYRQLKSKYNKLMNSNRDIIVTLSKMTVESAEKERLYLGDNTRLIMKLQSLHRENQRLSQIVRKLASDFKHMIPTFRSISDLLLNCDITLDEPCQKLKHEGDGRSKITGGSTMDGLVGDPRMILDVNAEAAGTIPSTPICRVREVRERLSQIVRSLSPIPEETSDSIDNKRVKARGRLGMRQRHPAGDHLDCNRCEDKEIVTNDAALSPRLNDTRRSIVEFKEAETEAKVIRKENKIPPGEEEVQEPQPAMEEILQQSVLLQEEEKLREHQGANATLQPQEEFMEIHETPLAMKEDYKEKPLDTKPEDDDPSILNVAPVSDKVASPGELKDTAEGEEMIRTRKRRRRCLVPVFETPDLFKTSSLHNSSSSKTKDTNKSGRKTTPLSTRNSVNAETNISIVTRSGRISSRISALGATPGADENTNVGATSPVSSRVSRASVGWRSCRGKRAGTVSSAKSDQENAGLMGRQKASFAKGISAINSEPKSTNKSPFVRISSIATPAAQDTSEAEIIRRSGRSRKAISYKEPSTTSKLRRL